MSIIALPSVRDEAWRWSDLSVLPVLAEAQPSGRVPTRLPWLDCQGPRLLFVDGKLVTEQSDPGPVKIGRVHSQPTDHALAKLVGREGWSLTLGRDHAPAGLVQIIHLSTGGADHLPAELSLGIDAQASLVETYVGTGWTNRLTTIRLGSKARLMLTRRLLAASGFASLTDHAEVGEGASLALTMLMAGGADSRIDTNIVLTGKAAFAEASGALLARGRQRHDANLALRHAVEGTMSRQFWCSVAGGKATASIAARIEVGKHAQKSDGEQSLKGLLLDQAASINLKPELEIFADDVKCAHGASVGALDSQALFYLASRGISPDEAKALLIEAFIQNAIARIGEEKVRAGCAADAAQWLG